jgi:CHAT domain-containing protein
VHEDAIRTQKDVLAVLQSQLGAFDPDVADAFHELGLAHHEANDFSKALAAYQSANAIRERIGQTQSLAMAATYNNIANIYWELGEYEQAKAIHALALDIKLRLLPENHPDVATTYDNLGNVYADANDHSAALPLLRKSLEIRTAALGNHLFVGFSLNNYGQGLQAIGRTRESIPYLRKALLLEETLGSPRSQYVGNTSLALGKALVEIGKLEEGAALIDSAVSILRDTQGPSLPLAILEWHKTHSSRLSSSCQPPRAALAAARERLPPAHPFAIRALNALAACLYEQGDFESSRLLLDSALTLNNSLLPHAVVTVPTVQLARSNLDLLATLEIIARVHSDLSACSYPEIQCMTFALHALATAASVVDQIRSGTTSQLAKLRFLNRAASLYDDGLRLAVTIYEHTTEQQYLDVAFMFSERRRTPLLLDALANNSATSQASSEHPLQERLSAIAQSIAFGERQLEHNILQDPSIELTIAHRLYNLREEYRTLEATLMADSPGSLAQRYDNRAATIRDLQDFLTTDRRSLISYSVLGDTIILFAVLPDSAIVRQLPLHYSLRTEISALRDAIWHNNIVSFKSSAHSLGQTLLSAIPQNFMTPEILIVLDDSLVALPFETLLLTGTTTADSTWQGLPYLLKRHSVAYSYSASLLLQTFDIDRVPHSDRLLAVAPLYDQPFTMPSDMGDEIDGDANTLDPIPGSLTETQAIIGIADRRLSVLDRILGRSNTLLIGADATEQALLNLELTDYRYIHMASHASSSSTELYNAGIYLYPRGGGSDDNVLRFDEIGELSLNAELLVLSACDTGIGFIHSGEGLISMSTEFIAAGAQNLIVSLWPSEDEAASFIMPHFYHFLFEGANRATSLQQAKLRQLARGGARAAPLHWAPFVLVGS